MDAIHEFDLRCRGAASVVERWRNKHDQVQALWQIEDITALYLDVFAIAEELLAASENSSAGRANQTHHRAAVLQAINILIDSAKVAQSLIDAMEQKSFQVSRSNDFRRAYQRLVEVLDESDWPHRAALSGGSLDNWE